MKKMKLILLGGLFTLLTSCAITGNLKNNCSRDFPIISYNVSNVTFIETRAASGDGVTLAEVLEAEKAKYGSNITICNIVEQNKEIKLFYLWTIGISKSYVYDVVKFKN